MGVQSLRSERFINRNVQNRAGVIWKRVETAIQSRLILTTLENLEGLFECSVIGRPYSLKANLTGTGNAVLFVMS